MSGVFSDPRVIFDGPEACNRIKAMTDAEIEESRNRATRAAGKAGRGQATRAWGALKAGPIAPLTERDQEVIRALKKADADKVSVVRRHGAKLKSETGVAGCRDIRQHTTKRESPMRNKIHPADRANIDAIAEASSFTVSLFHGGAHQKHENIPTLAAARAQGLAMQAKTGSSRLSLVYAVLKDGRSFPVPRDYQAPTTPTENPMPNITAAPAKDRPKKAAAPKTARKPAPKASQTAARTAAGDRARFDWKTAEERATQGTLPSKLDFSADTHKSYRPLLAEIEMAAKAGDVATLKKIKHDGFQGSSVRAALRWRDLCVKALNAKK